VCRRRIVTLRLPKVLGRRPNPDSAESLILPQDDGDSRPRYTDKIRDLTGDFCPKRFFWEGGYSVRWDFVHRHSFLETMFQGSVVGLQYIQDLALYQQNRGFSPQICLANFIEDILWKKKFSLENFCLKKFCSVRFCPINVIRDSAIYRQGRVTVSEVILSEGKGGVIATRHRWWNRRRTHDDAAVITYSRAVSDHKPWTHGR